MSRLTECKDCGKRIAHEPGRRNRCLVCLDKRAKAREVPWCTLHMAKNGNLVFLCKTCKDHRVFENYKEPIQNDCEKIESKRDGKPVKVMASLLDRLTWAFARFQATHRKCGAES